MDLVVHTFKGHLTTTIERYRESGGIDKDTLLIIGFVCFAKILLIDIIFGRSGQLICHFIGFAYPAYRTTKVIESRHQRGKDEEDKIQWLMYWVVFASFHLVEFFSDTILGWIPMYWICKSLFLLACMSPLNLCSVIYHVIVLPLFKRSEKIIDTLVADWRNYAVNQCKKSLSIEARYGLLELAALSDSLPTYAPNVNSGVPISPPDHYKLPHNIDMSSRFEELENLSNGATDSTSNVEIEKNMTTRPFIESSTRLRELAVLSDSIILPRTEHDGGNNKLHFGSTGTTFELPESPPAYKLMSSINSNVNNGVNNEPRPSPKKKRAPPPPRQLNINDERKIEEYLNDNF